MVTAATDKCCGVTSIAMLRGEVYSYSPAITLGSRASSVESEFVLRFRCVAAANDTARQLNQTAMTTYWHNIYEVGPVVLPELSDGREETSERAWFDKGKGEQRCGLKNGDFCVSRIARASTETSTAALNRPGKAARLIVL
uniref:OSJNBa0023J03.19 protein n=2 Tax=Oryza sativa TaxID=4530 RepID=Q7F9F6_ORYSJ|nr:OSJNBa0024J22.9 [Oryza sativa Japonica Group]CAE05124.2 OSJNBa0023J03.19 [Oryza sativa Japonica Group]CAH66159.1 OSIGBa0113B06.5 [Oryza sativa]